jgi:hypothetical protein
LDDADAWEFEVHAVLAHCAVCGEHGVRDREVPA